MHGEHFLVHSEQGGKLLVFCTKTELAVLHQSLYLVCDGTFEMAPNYQIYTTHGYTAGGEGLPLLWALLPNKSTLRVVQMPANGVDRVFRRHWQNKLRADRL